MDCVGSAEAMLIRVLKCHHGALTIQGGLSQAGSEAAITTVILGVWGAQHRAERSSPNSEKRGGDSTVTATTSCKRDEGSA